MEVKDAQNRTTKEVGERKNIRNTEDRAGSLGTVQLASGKSGVNPIGTSGENCLQGDTSVSPNPSFSAIAGKIASQLINEAEKELAYYQTQAEVLKERIQALKTISEIPTDK
jgi:hypothetical protein